jgi:hypothetical protein
VSTAAWKALLSFGHLKHGVYLADIGSAPTLW